MLNPELTDITKTLEKPDLHEEWIKSYRIKENALFYDDVFDKICFTLSKDGNPTILDAGCGSGAHSVRLAKRGFNVLGIDISKYILEKAKSNIRLHNVENKIQFSCEDITSLPYENQSFKYILCWGVLMHIPDIDQAIAELTRVLKKSGTLIIEEGNMHSLQSFLTRIKGIFEKRTTKKSIAGIEYWKSTTAGKLLTREANIIWLKKKLKEHGCVIKKHIPGQFTELYTKGKIEITKKLLHYFNRFWFKYIKLSTISYGAILIVHKVK